MSAAAPVGTRTPSRSTAKPAATPAVPPASAAGLPLWRCRSPVPMLTNFGSTFFDVEEIGNQTLGDPPGRQYRLWLSSKP
jgi:hypothetical protein